jgi:adenylate kinase family enzyme
MNKQFYILMGRSGSGKGTQAALLKKAMEEKGFSNVLHITTGGGFREFIKRDTYISKLALDVNDTGGLQPEFLAVWSWANTFINTFVGDESVILDGAPRKPFEAGILHSAISFLGYHKPVVIYLDVSERGSREHIVGRGRDDDKDESDVTNRMNWFETDVLPTLEVYFNDPRYTVLHINGNQTIEGVHNEIVEKIGLMQVLLK